MEKIGEISMRKFSKGYIGMLFVIFFELINLVSYE